MTIWADADSLPLAVRKLIYRRSQKSNGNIQSYFVACRKLPDKNINMIVCVSADEYILSNSKAKDILVTRDIPLAARAIENGLVVINDRGTVWNRDTIKERLSVRSHMLELRNAGLIPPMSTHSNFTQKDEQAFSNALDKALCMCK